jgi:hypothetical protein
MRMGLFDGLWGGGGRIERLEKGSKWIADA